MKKDIKTRKDLEIIVLSFYTKVSNDELLGKVFENTLQNHWDKHISTMVDFFDNMIFYSGAYLGNPMELHLVLNTTKHLSHEQFDRWLIVFEATVTSVYEGVNTDTLLEKTTNIAKYLENKIVDQNE
ncbi:MAG: group III truncated hemoglobin [Saprospiraceae bacterium]|nr:group III truncated hemoglobin [Saprospiraceae bacterium]